ncbi:hypothetical protein C8T65DRAFT_673231 [Cerioporus squamosus]|nr:hypothetical protein C8T65DRAFT_673231 [Cerioporus squamosus]
MAFATAVGLSAALSPMVHPARLFRQVHRPPKTRMDMDYLHQRLSSSYHCTTTALIAPRPGWSCALGLAANALLGLYTESNLLARADAAAPSNNAIETL